MLENLKRQEAVSPTIDRARTLEMLFQLQTLYFGDDEAVVKYGEPAYWEDLSGGLLTCCCCCRATNKNSKDDTNIDYADDHDPPRDRDNSKKDETARAQDMIGPSVPLPLLPSKLLNEITSRGYFVLPPPPCRNNSKDKEQPSSTSTASSLSSTLEALANAGWPPQFLLMYDETWELLKDTVRAIVGDDADDNFYIESDVNIWSLKRNDPPGNYYIGGNFIKPHRDMVYNACHDEDDQPTSLSVWVPLNPSGATNHNGCMRIIPIEEDDFFYSPQHPNHSMNSKYANNEDTVAENLVCAQFGSCVWDPTCVHWGGGFEADKSEQEPRASLAFTIRLGGKAAHFGTTGTCTSLKQQQQTGPEACLVKNCDKGDSKRRLQMVAKSLLAYSHHWPGFPFEGFRENMGLSR